MHQRCNGIGTRKTAFRLYVAFSCVVSAHHGKKNQRQKREPDVWSRLMAPVSGTCVMDLNYGIRWLTSYPLNDHEVQRDIRNGIISPLTPVSETGAINGLHFSLAPVSGSVPWA